MSRIYPFRVGLKCRQRIARFNMTLIFLWNEKMSHWPLVIAIVILINGELCSILTGVVLRLNRSHMSSDELYLGSGILGSE